MAILALDARAARYKKIFVGFLFAYSFLLFTLLTINFHNLPAPKAEILMGMTLLILWVIIGGGIQKYFQKKYTEHLISFRKNPVLYFTFAATILSCIEEAIAVVITNLAPFYGVQLGEAYITASLNYFTVIFFHSVIVFIPMFATLGFLLKRYDITPFHAFILFGFTGVFAETLFAGLQATLNAPFWVLVYGLMVYLPSHIFLNLERKKLSRTLYPLLILPIAFSAVLTAWIPAVLGVPRTDFAPIETEATSLPA